MSTTHTASTITCLTCEGTGTDPVFGDDCANCSGTGRKQTARTTVHTPASEAPASEAQVNYLRSLREQLASLDATAEAELLDSEIEKATKRSASKLIDQAKALVASVRDAQRQARQVERKPIEIEDGFYVFGEGDDATVVKVQYNRARTNLYAKALDGETGSFEYVPGLVAKVAKTGRKLTLDEAKHLGHLYGRCCCCGATLTDEHSIEAGIGPVCASKL